tara:strand:- start:1543 stop:1878 length:336 start_codon:yes stop_codon:yes gene_type:complete
MPKNNEDFCSQLIFSMKDDGELYIDINIEDESDDSIKYFAKLISALGTMQLQIEALQIASNGIIETMPEKIDLFLIEITRIASKKLSKEDADPLRVEGKKDEPCIKPSDLI